MEEKPDSLTTRDHLVNTSQGILKGIPYIGSSLEHFIFGPLTELRMRRIESTLTEIAEALKDSDAANCVSNEQFVNLLEAVTPDLSRATDQQRRQRFRDLLLNAAKLPPESSEWSEATLASELLREIDAPGLAILAAVARASKPYPLTLTSLPEPQLYEDEFDYDNPSGPQHPLNYDWTVVEEWARRLKEMRLLSFQSSNARGGFGGVQFGPLGKFLVRWVIADA